MRVSTSKSKNAESFYITFSYLTDEGKVTTNVYRKLGTLDDLLAEHGPTRDDVMAWAKAEAEKETKKYEEAKENRKILVEFYPNMRIQKGEKRLFRGGYLFLQSIYYRLQLDKTCGKIRDKHKFEYDLNAILSDLIYTRVLEPCSKRASYETAKSFLEPPKYELYDVYRALQVLGDECDFIQAEVYKNSRLMGKRNDRVLYYDCTNYYFEIEGEDGMKQYGKSKEHRPNPIVQMGLFMDADGFPLAFSLFSGKANEQTSVKPLEKKILNDFEHKKFIYCSDAGLGSESNREFNHIGERAFVVTQSIKKLNKEDKAWALNKEGFRRLSDNSKVDPSEIAPNEEEDDIFYKDEPYVTKRIDQRLIVTYSPKYAAYQRAIRNAQISRAQTMIDKGECKRNGKNPDDPARFITKQSSTPDGEVAYIDEYFLNQDKIAEEEQYEGMYAVCTDLLDDDAKDIVKVSENRWRMEECFRIMKTEFSARPVDVQLENSITAHFLVCILALLEYRILEKMLGGKYTCSQILKTLRGFDYHKEKDRGFSPAFERTDLTDDLQKALGLDLDYDIIPKDKMRNIEKNSKGRENRKNYYILKKQQK